MFEVGDVVMLCSGGLAMTVGRVEGAIITVVWHDEVGCLHSERVTEDVLVEFDFHDCEDDECMYH